MTLAGETVLVALFVRALFYGLYLATLVHCIRWLVCDDCGWKIRGMINRPILIVTILIFVLSTTNLGLTFQYKLWLRRGNDWPIFMECILGMTEVTTVLIVDAVLVYRCWIIYGKSWTVVSLPGIFWFGSLASAIACLYFVYEAWNPRNEPWASNGWRYAFSSLYFCNILTNLFATVAIIRRLVHAADDSGTNFKLLHNISRILAESGILYTSTTVFMVVELLIGKNIRFDIGGALSDAMNFSVAGIVFNLIIVRVNAGRVNLADSCADSKFYEERGDLTERRFNIAHTAQTPGQVIAEADNSVRNGRRARRYREGLNQP